MKQRHSENLQFHKIPPVYNGNSETLILGSFPSVASREEGFFYAHPQNRFWKVLAALFDSPVPASKEEKIALILNHRLALYDVIGSCEIAGSADSSVKKVRENDLTPILSASHITRIFVNGKTAEKYYLKYIRPKIGIDCICLPSTSAANASCSLADLIGKWRIVTAPEK